MFTIKWHSFKLFSTTDLDDLVTLPQTVSIGIVEGYKIKKILKNDFLVKAYASHAGYLYLLQL